MEVVRTSMVFIKNMHPAGTVSMFVSPTDLKFISCDLMDIKLD
jgi:hypothetical protein